MAEVIKLPDQISSIQNVEVISKDVQITDDTKESLAVKEEPILSDQYPTENTNSVTAVNGFPDGLHDDELLSQIDDLVTANDEELSSLKANISRLESANKHLEVQLAQISQQKYQEIQSTNKSLSEYEAQNEALQKTVDSQNNEIKKWKEIVDINDKAARKAIEGYKAEHQANIEKVNKKYSECVAEKETMVVRYAQGETKIAQLQSTIDKLESRVKDREREKDVLSEKLRSLKSESTKHTATLQEKVSEAAVLKQELESQKEALSSHEYRTKWAQNKLKSEVDAHKETKLKLDEMTRRYKETKEECVTIRVNCQEMIKTYQESEDIKSNSLDVELKKKVAELEDKETLITRLSKESAELKTRLEESTKEMTLLRKQYGAGELKLQELENVNEVQAKEVEDLNACISSLREENSQIRSKLQEMQSLKHDLEVKETECLELHNQLGVVQLSSEENQSEMEICKKRESELLLLTQKMTERNAELQSANSVLNSKLAGIGATTDHQDNEISRLEQSLQEQELLLAKEKSLAQSEIEKGHAEIAELKDTVKDLNSDVEAYQTEIRTLKKKQVSSVKELTREVHTLRRQLEAHESKYMDEGVTTPAAVKPGSSHGRGGSAPVSLSHSRTNSSSSLDKQDSWVVVNLPRQSSPEHSSQPTVPEVRQGQQVRGSDRFPGVRFRPVSNDSLEPQFLEPDKQKMIEKIVKLQKINARKNEKLDFCQDHISQLIEQVQRKTRIIQMYAMKEQAGALSSDTMDRNKKDIAKKGGIMASISNRQTKDDSMNLQLSLKINNQLQAVLEDTLLKNITLKENMDTLGQEIAKISAENSSLKHQLIEVQSS